MRVLISRVILMASLIFFGGAAEASWLIDAERYHVSAHGHLSCQDCHSDIMERDVHPDPAVVNRSLEDFFDPESCAACHDDAADEIAAGSHAGQKATPWQRFDNCLECHQPHYQAREGETSGHSLLNLPAREKCSRCHEFQAELPEPTDDDQQCLQCHRGAAGNDPVADSIIFQLCFHCHDAANQENPTFPLIDQNGYAETPHRDVSCLVCHPLAAQFEHGNQKPGSCKQCHRPHAESVTHDLHAIVSCGACHLNGIEPVSGPAGRSVVWRRPEQPDNISVIHQMSVPPKDDACRSCHIAGNPVGAVAMVLPAKSVICMPCHAATFSAGDTITLISLVIFLAGLVVVGSVWFAVDGQLAGTRNRLVRSARSVLCAIFSNRIFAIIVSLLVDGLLQRRLWRISKERWLLHALVFYPIGFRFTWGLLGLLGSLWHPQWSGGWSMLDKNHPLTAFLFDLSGTMVIIGTIGMIIGRVQKRTTAGISGLPPADWPAYILLGGIMVVGFILEGMRMAMTGNPDGASWAFAGDLISRMLAGYELTGLYGYVWYLHAILTGAFVIYLPFSRMFHLIMAPVTLAINAASDAHKPAG